MQTRVDWIVYDSSTLKGSMKIKETFTEPFYIRREDYCELLALLNEKEIAFTEEPGGTVHLEGNRNIIQP